MHSLASLLRSQYRSSRKLLRESMILFFYSVVLGGCSNHLPHDADQGTEIATFRGAVANESAGSISLPMGTADIRFVVPDHDCVRSIDVVVDFDLEFADGRTVKEVVRMSDLTWPIAGHDCRPIGFLRNDKVINRRPLRMEINRESNPLKYSIRLAGRDVATTAFSIWVVYNDRDPVERMLGQSQGSDSNKSENQRKADSR